MNEFKMRIEEVNNDPNFLVKIKKAIVFGSYLSNEQRINDLDIAVELTQRYEDFEIHEKKWDERINKAIMEGRRFRNYNEKILWPVGEVYKYLKGHSKMISLHSMEEFQRLNISRHKVIFKM